MSISAADSRPVFALSVIVTDDTLTVDLSRWPIDFRASRLVFTRLTLTRTSASRIYLLDGKPSGENQRSFRGWLDRWAGGSVSEIKAPSQLPEKDPSYLVGISSPSILTMLKSWWLMLDSGVVILPDRGRRLDAGWVGGAQPKAG